MNLKYGKKRKEDRNESVYPPVYKQVGKEATRGERLLCNDT